VQSLGCPPDQIEVPVEVVGVERRHCEPSLALPVRALGCEHACAAGLGSDYLDLPPAPEFGRASPEDLVDRRRVGDADNSTRA
jgi:hypothetical protein